MWTIYFYFFQLKFFSVFFFNWKTVFCRFGLAGEWTNHVKSKCTMHAFVIFRHSCDAFDSNKRKSYEKRRELFTVFCRRFDRQYSAYFSFFISVSPFVSVKVLLNGKSHAFTLPANIQNGMEITNIWTFYLFFHYFFLWWISWNIFSLTILMQYYR